MDIGQFLLNIRKPLSTNGDVKKILEAYRKSSNLYQGLTRVGTENKVMFRYDVAESDKYYASIFNEWKKEVIAMPREHYVKLASQKKVESDFIDMRDALKDIGDVSTKDEVMKIINEYPKEVVRNAFDKYNPFDQAGMSWTYITSRYVDCRQSSSFYIQHRLYLNIDGPYTHYVANYVREFAKKNNLLYEFKFDECADRADTFVLYCSNENLMLFVNCLEKMVEENPELESHLHQPPVLTGSYKGFIGYGEEYDKAKSSYNSDRADALQEVLDNDYREWRKEFPTRVYETDGNRYRPLDYIVYKVYMSLFDEDLKNYKWKKDKGYLKPGDNIKLLNDRQYQIRLFNAVKKFVYTNKDSIYNNTEPVLRNMDRPSIFERGSSLSYFKVNEALRDLYVSVCNTSKDKLGSLKDDMLDALGKCDIARSVVVSEETRDKVLKFNAFESRVKKVTAAKRASNKAIYTNILFTLDKMAQEIEMNRGNSLKDLNDSLEPLKLKVNSFISQLTRFQIREYSGSSQDYDERTQYYIYCMLACIKRFDLNNYEEFRSLAVAYEKIDEDAKKL